MNETLQLLECIKKGIEEKKGRRTVIIDLDGIDGAIARYFVICEGGSPTQVEAIVEAIGEAALTELSEKPANVVGLGLSQWVAMDYGDVLVHVFVPEMRQFYDIENLWQDAQVTEIEDKD